MWTENRSLTATEILNLLPNKLWKDSTVHMHINGLLEKNIIHVTGMERAGKTYARKFSAAVSAADYLAKQLKQSPVYMADKNKKLKGVLASLVGDDDISLDTLNRLEDLIRGRKKELDSK